MKNAYAISSLAHQLKAVAEKLESLSMGAQEMEQQSSDLSDVYQSLLVDEVEHVQILTLEITKAVVEASEQGEEHADDGSVFGPGELTDDKSNEPIENPVDPEKE